MAELESGGDALQDELRRYAQLMGVEIVSSSADVGDYVLASNPELLRWLDDAEARTNQEFVVMEDGRIFTSSPASQVAWQLTRLVERILNVQAIVLPATPLLVHTLSQGADAPLIAQVDTSENDVVGTDAQRLLANIVDQAILIGATDIHIESRDAVARVRYRVSGRLSTLAEMPASDAIMMAHYCFSVARRGTKQWIAMESQNAAVDVVVSRGRVVPLRIATVPEIRGFDIIFRILRPAQKIITLESAGYLDVHVDLINEAFARPYGVICLSGPTGSGKSTTLLAALERLPGNLKVVSLEAPVERPIFNCSHVSAASEGDLGRMLADVNRWDNDVTVLGELRDPGTARALVDFVTSGKLVITTVHASNVLAVPRRMHELGVDWSILTDPEFLVSSINQRLMPKLCNNCSIPLNENMDRVPRYRWKDFERLFAGESAGGDVRLTGTGCSQCVGGAAGRTLCAEVALTDDQDRDFIRSQDTLGWRRDLIDRGWHPIVHHALKRVRAGELDPLVAEQAAGNLAGGAGGRTVVDYKARLALV